MNTYISTIAEAAATLSGLIFVGLSLNLKRVLSVKHLPAMALWALMLLTNILMVASFCLLTGQPRLWPGAEVPGCGLLICMVTGCINIGMYQDITGKYKFHYYRNLIFTQLAVLSFQAAGVLLLPGSGTGLLLADPGRYNLHRQGPHQFLGLLVEINR